MTVVSELKLSANEIASIIVRSNFSDADLVAIQTAVKYRQSKNTMAPTELSIGQTIHYKGPMGGVRKAKVLHVTPQYCVVKYQSREIYIKRDKILAQSA